MAHKMKKKTTRATKRKKAMSYGKKMAGYGKSKMPKSSKYSYKAKQ